MPATRLTRLTRLATAMLTMTLGLTSCSDDPADPESTSSPTTSVSPSEPTSESPTPSNSTPSPTADRPTIHITFDGDTVTPNGERVTVPVGEPIDLVVTADQPGELHVHSTPEQQLAYKAGTTTLSLTIDQPGVVEVESHDLEVVVVQLEVR